MLAKLGNERSVLAPAFPSFHLAPWQEKGPFSATSLHMLRDADSVRSAARYHFKALILPCCGQPEGMVSAVCPNHFWEASGTLSVTDRL